VCATRNLVLSSPVHCTFNNVVVPKSPPGWLRVVIRFPQMIKDLFSQGAQALCPHSPSSRSLCRPQRLSLLYRVAAGGFCVSWRSSRCVAVSLLNPRHVTHAYLCETEGSSEQRRPFAELKASSPVSSTCSRAHCRTLIRVRPYFRQRIEVIGRVSLLLPLACPYRSCLMPADDNRSISENYGGPRAYPSTATMRPRFPRRQTCW